MENKSNDTPKIIGLSIAILLTALFFVWRYISATQPAAPRAANSGETTATTAAVGTDATPAAMNASATTGAAENAGLMRDVTDIALDPDQPIQLTSGRRNSVVFQQLKAPTIVAFKPVKPRIDLTANGSRIRDTPPVGPVPPPPPAGHWEELPSLEVRLDGVYEVGSERVSELTMRDTGPKDALPQTVYRRVGESVGPFKIAGISTTGITLTGQRRQWIVGDTQNLSQGQRWVMQMPAALTTTPANSGALPAILPPGR